MKILHLIGGKATPRARKDRALATVRIRAKRVCVESDIPEVQQQIAEHIDLVVRANAIFLHQHISRRNRAGEEIEHVTAGRWIQPGHPRFLDALRDSSWLWQDEEFAGYEVDYLASYVADEPA
jgi:hypothetical protein